MCAVIYPRSVSRTYRNIDVVHGKCSEEQVHAEKRSDDQRNWQYEWCQEVEQCFVELLEDEEFGANPPDPEFPGEEDVSHVVVHSIDEEEVPSVKALAKDGHLAKTAAAAAREENRGRCLRLHEDGSAHCDTTS